MSFAEFYLPDSRTHQPPERGGWDWGVSPLRVDRSEDNLSVNSRSDYIDQRNTRAGIFSYESEGTSDGTGSEYYPWSGIEGRDDESISEDGPYLDMNDPVRESHEDIAKDIFKKRYGRNSIGGIEKFDTRPSFTVPIAKIKLAIMGSFGIGKTTLIARYANRTFETNHNVTIGVVYSTRKMLIDGNTIDLNIWDTAGAERYRALMPMYIRGAHTVLLCFHSPDLDYIIETINNINDLNTHPVKPAIILVITKSDLVGSSNPDRVEASSDRGGTIGSQGNGIDILGYYKDIFDYASKEGLKIIVTSAKTGEGVDICFQTAARKGLRVWSDNEAELKKNGDKSSSPVVFPKIKDDSSIEKSRGWCCSS